MSDSKSDFSLLPQFSQFDAYIAPLAEIANVLEVSLAEALFFPLREEVPEPTNIEYDEFHDAMKGQRPEELKNRK